MNGFDNLLWRAVNQHSSPVVQAAQQYVSGAKQRCALGQGKISLVYAPVDYLGRIAQVAGEIQMILAHVQHIEAGSRCIVFLQKGYLVGLEELFKLCIGHHGDFTAKGGKIQSVGSGLQAGTTQVVQIVRNDFHAVAEGFGVLPEVAGERQLVVIIQGSAPQVMEGRCNHAVNGGQHDGLSGYLLADSAHQLQLPLDEGSIMGDGLQLSPVLCVFQLRQVRQAVFVHYLAQVGAGFVEEVQVNLNGLLPGFVAAGEMEPESGRDTIRRAAVNSSHYALTLVHSLVPP